jgi:hypothetical protein
MSCQICFNTYTYDEEMIPRILPCGHTFCSSCILRLVTMTSKRPFKCPNCRTDHRRFRNIESYPKNYSLFEEMTRNENEPPQPSEDSLQSQFHVMCSHHPQKRYEYYDEKCERFVCSDCVAVGAHVGHKCITIATHQTQCENELKDIERLLPDFISSLTQGEETAHRRSESLDARYSTLQLEIDSDWQRYLCDDPQRHNELLSTLKDSYETQRDSSKLHLQKVTDLKEAMVELLAHCLDRESRSVNCCSLSLLEQLRNSFRDLKMNYDSLRAFFRRLATDFDWSSPDPGLTRTDFTPPGTPTPPLSPLAQL